jgi:hypothetical protein
MKLRARIQLDVPTMGCVACIRSIDGALAGQASSHRARVVSAASSLNPLGIKGGTVSVEAEALDETALSELVSRLIDATDKAGFAGATAASIRTQEVSEGQPSSHEPEL